MEGALRAGESLTDHARFRADENGHGALSGSLLLLERRAIRSGAGGGPPIGDASAQAKPEQNLLYECRRFRSLRAPRPVTA
jgi:hypothetical protein